MRQNVYEGLAWESLIEQFDLITDSGYSVSMFTRWGETIDQVWVKSRVAGAREPPRGELSAPSRQSSTVIRSSASTP